MILPRRGFLLGLGALIMAPAIVRFESLMPVRSIARLITGVPELVFYDSDGGVLFKIDAPSEPLDPNVFGQIYNSPRIGFDVARSCLVARVELMHPEFGRLNVQLGGGPTYVMTGQKAVLDKFDMRLT
jgi:hypothetical protein